jgi:hypothetical protein
MKELNTFREYLSEGKYKIGDKVILRGRDDFKVTDEDILTVTDMRKMFASDLIAYTVRFSDGKETEYDETQLVGYENVSEDKKENLKEGTWAMGNPDDIRLFIRKIKELEEDYYNVVGNDDVFDGLGMAKRGAEFVLKMATQKNK